MKNLLFNNILNILLVVMVLPPKVWGQNLVMNGGFEEYSNCPSNLDQLEFANWWRVGSGSPDFFHSCSSNVITGIPKNITGTSFPKSGEGLAHITLLVLNSNVLIFHEYLRTKLNTSLLKGHVYCLEFWLKNTDTSRYAYDKLGVRFNNEDYWQEQGQIFQNPQMETKEGFVLNFNKWTKVELEFTAEGEERFMIIGQFNSYNELNILEINPSNLDNNAGYLIDDISLVDCTPELFLEIPNVFTPNADGENDSFTATIENAKSVQVHIYNRWGGEVFSSQDPNFRWNGTHKGEDLAEGVYFVVIQAVGLNGETATEKQTVHLLR